MSEEQRKGEQNEQEAESKKVRRGKKRTRKTTLTKVQWSSEKVRKTFVDYFCAKHGHLNVPSSPVVPYGDPTLLFTNSGMNQFKGIFLGHVDPRSEQAKWKRVANSQKCIRAGGKHNDLDDTGRDTYHHTFFEMLGNWSFGDYFQEESIGWAWELLTQIYKLDVSRLYVTYFRGDEKDGIPADVKAKELWKKYLPEDRILPFGKKENFWEMGETGPCGPCSEIHYDLIGSRDASAFVNADRPDVIEIWNLVFMQFNREEGGKLTELPNKHVDTGMGFERLTCVLQGKMSNYDTDIFRPFFTEIQKVTGARPYQGLVGAADKDGIDTAYRIIADHIRTAAFAVTDGITPGPSGRNHVLRRILRRAIRQGREFLNAPDGFFHELVEVVVTKFGEVFPELRRDPKQVKKVIQREEQLFTRTLNKGIRMFQNITKNMTRGGVISGKDALALHLQGFPIDLVQTMGTEKGITVDLVEFEKELQIISIQPFKEEEEQTKFKFKPDDIAKLQTTGVRTTNDSFKYNPDGLDTSSKVVGIWKGKITDGGWVKKVEQGTLCALILDKTNFYSEAGGQVHDTGIIEHVKDKFKFVVQDTQVTGGYVAHVGTSSGPVSVGDEVTCSIEMDRRIPITMNHTCTHMINHAIREKLYAGANQLGSIVSDEKLRFDFNCPEVIPSEKIDEIQQSINNQVKNSVPVYMKEIPKAAAMQIPGIRAIFTEAYPDPVRVVSVGVEIPDKFSTDPAVLKTYSNFSIELCGGTHIKNTSELESFVIVALQGNDSKGVRRVEAVTGSHAKVAVENGIRLEKYFENLKKLPVGDKKHEGLLWLKQELEKTVIPVIIRMRMSDEIKTLDDEIMVFLKGRLGQKLQSKKHFLESVTESLKNDPSLQVISLVLEVGGNNKILNDSCVEIVNCAKENFGRDVAVFLASTDPKAKTPRTIFAAKVPTSLIAKGLSAHDWVSTVAKEFGGKGKGNDSGEIGQGNIPNSKVVGDLVNSALLYAKKKI